MGVFELEEFVAVLPRMARAGYDTWVGWLQKIKIKLTSICKQQMSSYTGRKNRIADLR
jgi:hypothetical protein